MKNSLFIIGAVFLLVFGFAFLNSQKQINPNTNKPTGVTTNTPLQNIMQISPTTAITQGTVPLPQATDIIRSFFSLIEARRISEAVGMMGDVVVGDESVKQAWGVQLNAIKSVTILDITPLMPEKEKDTKRTYKVTLDMAMDPSSETAPIPYYGYENGTNIRWITLERPGKMWQIMGLATGP